MYLCDYYTQPCIFVMSFAGTACLGNKAMQFNIVMYCHHVYGDIAMLLKYVYQYNAFWSG